MQSSKRSFARLRGKSHGQSDAAPDSTAYAGDHESNDHLITSDDPLHPANLIPELCRKFYTLGWVTGTGGGISIRQGDHIFIAPSGVQKEMLVPQDIFVYWYQQQAYLRTPQLLRPSACTPLFMACFDRGAGAAIHTHSQWAVLVTLLLETIGDRDMFEINELEQIKGIPSKMGEAAMGYHDTLRIPVIENTPHEEDLTAGLTEAIEKHPEACAVLVRRHGVYVWGEDVAKAKTQAESLDYLFQLAVEMRKLGIPWLKQGDDGQTEKTKNLHYVE